MSIYSDPSGKFDTHVRKQEAEEALFQKQKRSKQDPTQSVIGEHVDNKKEFGDENMDFNAPDQNAMKLGSFLKQVGGKGNTKETRGTQMTQVPTPPLDTAKPIQPLATPTNDNNPMTKAMDNVADANKRAVQSKFNMGPNGVNNMTGLSIKTNPYEAPQTQDPDRKMPGFAGKLANKVGSFFGLEDENHVGTGINGKSLFQDMEKSKPQEVITTKK